MADRGGVSREGLDAARSESLQAVAAIYAAWDEGRLDAAARLLPEDIVWETPPDSLEPSVSFGRVGAHRSMTEWLEQWADLEISGMRLEERGDRVLAAFVQRATGRMSGVAVEGPLFMLWTMRAGRPIRMQMFLREDQARAAFED